MIINALYQYYGTLLNDEHSKVSSPGFCEGKVSHCLVLSSEGNLLENIDLRSTSGRRLVPREIIIPEQQKRTVKITANFMCDNCTYVLGLGQKKKVDKKDRLKKCFKAFRCLHEKILGNIEDKGSSALLTFLRNWKIENATTHPVIVRYLDDLIEGQNLVFKLEGDKGYLHERKKIKEAWGKYKAACSSNVISQCLVTGKSKEVARLHPSIKGVTGAQSTGASLVSFNLDAFTSYGKSQSYNAPVSEEAAFAYTTALNYLLKHPKHRIRIGDTTTVFWAEQSSDGLEEDLLGALISPPLENNKKEGQKDKGKMERDPRTVLLLQDIFKRVKAGLPIIDELEGINKDTNFYILGLAPNASRLAVRFWHMDPYINFIQRIGQHYSDMVIDKSFSWEPDQISVFRILKETAPQKDSKRVAPLLGGILMRSILTGMPYPTALYNSIISRIRADREINFTRASVVKAYLVRNQRYFKKTCKGELTMALNEENRNMGYLLGRLFALLEKAQENANPGINATIKDRYFGAASASPGSVFPILLRLAQHHIAKAEYGYVIDKRIEGVVSLFNQFPAHLNLEDQGQFVLGYYQQRQNLFKKKESAK